MKKICLLFSLLLSTTALVAQQMSISMEPGEKVTIVPTGFDATADKKLLALPPFEIGQRWVANAGSGLLTTNDGIMRLHVTGGDPYIQNTKALIKAGDGNPGTEDGAAKWFKMKFKYNAPQTGSPEIRVYYLNEAGSHVGTSEAGFILTQNTTDWQTTTAYEMDWDVGWSGSRYIRVDFEGVQVGTIIEFDWMIVSNQETADMDVVYTPTTSDYFWKFNFSDVYNTGGMINNNAAIQVDRMNGMYDLMHRRWVVQQGTSNIIATAYCNEFNSESTSAEPLPERKNFKTTFLHSLVEDAHEIDDLNFGTFAENLVMTALPGTSSYEVCDGINLGSGGYMTHFEQLVSLNPDVSGGVKVLSTWLEGEQGGTRNPINVMTHLDATAADADHPTLAPNLDDYRGYIWYRGLLTQAAKRFGLPVPGRGTISEWAIGNEANNHRGWHFMGLGVTHPDFFKEYYKQMRISDIVVRSVNKHQKVMIEQDYFWNYTSAQRFSGRQMIIDVNTHAKSHGDFPWGIAKHVTYPQNLLDYAWWNGTSQTIHSYDTQIISIINVEVLFDFMQKPAFLYKGQPRNLSAPEGGIHANGTQAQQAGAFAYAFRKLDLSDRFHSWSYHSLIDEPISDPRQIDGSMASLDTGLYINTSTTLGEWFKGPKRLIYDVFSSITEPNWQTIADPYLSAIPITNWDQAAPKVTNLFFTFDDERSRTMWTKAGQATGINNFRMEDGRLKGISTTNDPTITLDTYLSAETADHVQLRIKSDQTGVFQMFWTTAATGFSATQTVTANITAGDFQHVLLTPAGAPNWVGHTITSLRIDPINVANANFEIDAIWSGYTGDIDGDGVLDADESFSIDADGDGIAQPYDFDDDGDGILDAEEESMGLSSSAWAYNFNQSNNELGLEFNNMTEPVIQNGILTANATSNDPMVILSDLSLDISARKAAGESIEVLMRSNAVTGVEIHWATDDDSGVISSTYSGTGMEIISFPLASVTDTSLIRWLRFDPGTQANAIIEIAYIGFSGTIDKDGDGIADAAEGLADLDADGIPNAYDTDSDGDGRADGWELSYGYDPLDAADFDLDLDGISNDADLDDDGDGEPDVYEAGVGRDPMDASDLGFVWNQDGYHGWFHEGGAGALGVDTYLIARADGPNSYIKNEEFHFNGANFEFLAIRYQAEKTGEMFVQYKRKGDTTWDSVNRAVSLGAYTTPNVPVMAVADFSATDWMTSTITGIRIQVVDGVDAVDFAHTLIFSIDGISGNEPDGMDTDGDGSINFVDADDDGDGMFDVAEAERGRNSLDPSDFGFTFDATVDGDYEGWTINSDIAAHVITAEQQLLGRAEGADPQFLQENLYLPGSLYSYLAIDYQAEATGQVAIYYKTVAEPTYDVSRSVTLDSYDIINQAVTHIADFSAQTEWTSGIITGIRVHAIPGTVGTPVHTWINQINGITDITDTDGDGVIDSFDADDDGDGMDDVTEVANSRDPLDFNDFGFAFTTEENNPEGWVSNSDVLAWAVSTGSFLINAIGADPYIENQFYFSGSDLQYIELDYQATVGGTIELHYQTEADPTWTESKKASLELYDAPYTRVQGVFDMSADGTWTAGTIIALRIHIIPGATEPNNQHTWIFGIAPAAAVGDDYTNWKTTHGVTDDEADNDGDGIANFVEFALGGDPNSANSGILPSVVRNGTDFEFTFKRQEASVTYKVEKSTDLSGWTEHLTVDDSHGAVGTDVTILVPDTEMVNGKLFLRMGVNN